MNDIRLVPMSAEEAARPSDYAYELGERYWEQGVTEEEALAVQSGIWDDFSKPARSKIRSAFEDKGG